MPSLKDVVNLKAGIQANFAISSEQTMTRGKAAACDVDLSIMQHIRK